MQDDPIQPLDNVGASRHIDDSRHVEGRSREPAQSPGHHRTITGEVTSVRRKSGHREGEHVLDTSVGAQQDTELVVKVKSGDVSDLTGTQVIIRIKP